MYGLQFNYEGQSMELYQYKEKPYDESDPESIERYAKKLIGHTFNEVLSWELPSSVGETDETKSYGEKSEKHKGKLGELIEEFYFGYKPNSNPVPDFPKAGVELKVTPYEKRKSGKLSAGERLVLTMIQYDVPVEPDIKKSHFWYKCQLLLLIFYLRDRAIANNLDFQIDYVKLFELPEEDLEIIIQDYKIIIDKIASGKAHELSESDTNYLGACTKGATAEKSIVPQSQYAPTVNAKRRAFCFKTSYMTYVLNTYVVPDKTTYEPIVKDAKELKEQTFEEIITSKIDRYIGKTDKELCELFDREYNNNKAQWIDLAYRMLGIKSSKAEEFEKAQIVVKAIRIEEDNKHNIKMVESSPIPTFSFKELVEEDWEDSELFTYFDETRFFFVVFKKEGDTYTLKGSQLWNMPYKDLNEKAYSGWEAIRKVLIDGVELTVTSNGVKNNFPKKGDNEVIHIRPHAQKSFYVFEDGSTYGSGSISDSDELPDGRRMTKQSFWLNNTYIVSQLENRLKQ